MHTTSWSGAEKIGQGGEAEPQLYDQDRKPCCEFLGLFTYYKAMRSYKLLFREERRGQKELTQCL